MWEEIWESVLKFISCIVDLLVWVFLPILFCIALFIIPTMLLIPEDYKNCEERTMEATEKVAFELKRQNDLKEQELKAEKQ